MPDFERTKSTDFKKFICDKCGLFICWIWENDIEGSLFICDSCHNEQVIKEEVGSK